MIALNVTFAGTVVFGLLAQFVRQREEALAALRVEQDRAESLLLNILPRSIADKLKADTGTIADQFASASILFADVVDFTPLSNRLQPAEVVGILDHLFTHFDVLADRYAVEKIKTIGDCYMVAAGVPSPRADHAQVMARMAIDMREAMHSQDAVGHLGLEIRIGINSGPVVAGVIGRKRFLYDLWGDAVNTASRMESHGTPGHIQVTRATYELLRDEFELEPRGTIPIKGKGDVETWYLVGRRDPGDRVVSRACPADVGRGGRAPARTPGAGRTGDGPRPGGRREPAVRRARPDARGRRARDRPTHRRRDPERRPAGAVGGTVAGQDVRTARHRPPAGDRGPADVDRRVLGPAARRAAPSRSRPRSAPTRPTR